LDLAEGTEKFNPKFFRERKKFAMMIDKCIRNPDDGKIKS